ncbi:integrase core domain-containing protein [Aureliella helgolandensis]|uniref:IS2 transposase TnpB n=1 Tax=Aureliella helgolandensis TaxID=2527968 RepID=A0A518GB64_9BACT|nr:integrase core domain-containing protein [Aureliella helgolandensis]QDV25819.1 IS2 transposase TnpB [Aureliella helgolandensis]
MVDFVRKWTAATDVTSKQLLTWVGLWSSTFSNWSRSYGRTYEHNGWVPRDHWLNEEEKQAILKFHFDHPLEGYRRLTYMMIDANIVACSAGTVYRVLSSAGLLRRNSRKSKKGTGFQQPLVAHEHWHIDISYLNIAGTFYFMATVLDGFSRSVVHWDIREKMEEMDIEVVLQKAREKYPDARPRIISDNGPQFIAKDFKHFVRLCGMKHVRTSPYYPQSNGKIERYHRTIKSQCIRPLSPLNLEEAKRGVAKFVEDYNTVRLHSAVGYVTPQAMLEGRQQAILEERDRKVEEARMLRAQSRATKRQKATPGCSDAPLGISYANSNAAEDRALLGSNSSAASSPLTNIRGGQHEPSLVTRVPAH